MKKILQINVYANSGSHGKICESIGNAALAHGFDSYIAYGREYNPSKSKLIKIGGKFNVLEHVLETRLFDNHGFTSRLATKKLLKQVDKIKPDIIHLHNIHGYYINIKYLFEYLAKKNIPVVWTLHDCWSFTGHCAHFAKIRCDKWKTGCYQCTLKKSYPTSFFVDNSKNNYKKKKYFFNLPKNITLVPVSYWLNDLLKDSFLNKYETKVIQNGIDTDLFRTLGQEQILQFKKENLLEGKFIILAVANIWIDSKGYKDYLKIAKKVSNDVNIVLVGSITDKQKKELPQNINAWGRTKSINELIMLYNTSDIFFNLTYADTFPTTNLESLACGTPVMTYNTGGSVESVSQDTGFIVEQGNLDGCLSVIDIVKQKGKEYYSNACRQRAVREFNREYKYFEYIKLYNKILGNHCE